MTPRVDRALRLYRRWQRTGSGRTAWMLSYVLAGCSAKETEDYYRALMREREARIVADDALPLFAEVSA